MGTLLLLCFSEGEAQLLLRTQAHIPVERGPLRWLTLGTYYDILSLGRHFIVDSWSLMDIAVSCHITASLFLCVGLHRKMEFDTNQKDKFRKNKMEYTEFKKNKIKQNLEQIKMDFKGPKPSGNIKSTLTGVCVVVCLRRTEQCVMRMQWSGVGRAGVHVEACT